MGVKVCKFGGTSMADGNMLKRVRDIVSEEDERKYVVVSAPGKRYSEDAKVTDLLYACHKLLDSDPEKGFEPVRSRFESIVRELNMGIDFSPVLDETLERIKKERDEQFTASRGEYLCAVLFAKVLGAKFVDAEDVILFDETGRLDDAATDKAVSKACAGEEKVVIPGFYGRGADGKVKTFSRGGSDITGAIIARAVGASLYENWTDVSGFLACDPRIVPSPKRIKSISYKELRELSYMGANVLHAESIFPVRSMGIPVKIKNTFKPEDEGTEILPISRYVPSGDVVTGIAGMKGFTVFYIEKSMMNSEVGVMGKILGIVAREGVSVEHVPSGIDTMSLVIASSQLTPLITERILEQIKEEVKPDVIRITENVALIATVGHGMSSSVGTSARLFSAIAAAGINVKMIDQGSSEINIIVGVKDEDYEKCIKAIYAEFFG